MFFGAVLFPVFLALSLAVDEGGPLILPIFIFFVGLAIMLYARLFREDTPSFQGERAQTSRLDTMAGVSALPPSNIALHGGPYQGRMKADHQLRDVPRHVAVAS